MNQIETKANDPILQIVGMAIRRRWWIIASTCIVPLVVIGVVFKLPNKYTSEATLLVVQQQVSMRYVDPTNTTSPGDVLKTMVRDVLSRNRLLGIIEAFGLYRVEKTKLSPDRLAERMRKDIEISPLDQVPGRSDFSAFMISFKADTPRTAQEVTSRLTSLFIEENLRSQGSQASTTSKFLTEQLNAAKQRLDQQDQRLRDFKLQNLGQLPEQEQSNLGTITDLRIQLQNNMANVSRAQQQRISIESILNGNLARLLSERSALLARLTAKHPDVLKKSVEIERTQALLNRLKAGRAFVEKPGDSDGPEDATIAQLKGQVEANTTELENLAREEQQLRAGIAQYQVRLRLTPVREQQLASILRDYELYKQDYTDLLNKQLRSQLTTNLEEQQAGQHFRLVDPPTLPTSPSSPQRLKISAGGLGAGIALGIALAFLMDLRHGCFHTEREVRHHFGAPLLIAMPVFRTPAEEKWRRLTTSFEWVAAGLAVAITLAAEFLVYRYG